MMHPDLLTKFLEITNFHKSYISAWFPNGRNSIRIRFGRTLTTPHNEKSVIFTYIDGDNWIIESEKAFLDKLRKV